MEFRTRNHSSFDSFPSPSLSAFVNIFFIWKKHLSAGFNRMLWNHQSNPITRSSKHLFHNSSLLGKEIVNTISDNKFSIKVTLLREIQRNLVLFGFCHFCFSIKTSTSIYTCFKHYKQSTLHAESTEKLTRKGFHI